MDSLGIKSRVVNLKPTNDAPMTCILEKPGVVRAINGRHYFSPARIMETAVALEIDGDQIARLIGHLVFDVQGGEDHATKP